MSEIGLVLCAERVSWRRVISGPSRAPAVNVPDLDERLSRMATMWTLVFEAHRGSEAGAVAARDRLIQRYRGAVYRYLLGAVRDADVAGDLCQEFILRFLRRDFRNVHPERGRFRDYVRTVLVHLVNDHHRSRQNWPQPLVGDAAHPAPA